MEKQKLILERIDKGLPEPKFAHKGDGGIDLMSTVDITLEPFEIKLIPLGVRVKMPEGTAGLIMSRSGLGTKGLYTMTGLIDSCYRGELHMIARNFNDKPFSVKRGERVCQLLMLELPDIELVYDEVNTSDTDRGEQGFGSSGV